MSVEILIPPSVKQAVLEDASVIQESNRHPDVYYFISKGGKLYSPEGFLIRRQIRRETFIDRQEAEAFDKMEKLSHRREQTIIWPSPAQFGVYDVTKLIITQVIKQEGYNLVFNKAVILDNVDSNQAVGLAQKLAEDSINKPRLRSVDDVRRNLIVLSPRQTNYLDILEDLAPDPQWQMIRSGQDIEFQKQALLAAKLVCESRFTSGEGEQARIEDYMGGNSLSCPPVGVSAYEAFLGHSGSPEGCKRIACKKCPWVATETEVQKIKEGLLRSCPDCGWKP